MVGDLRAVRLFIALPTCPVASPGHPRAGAGEPHSPALTQGAEAGHPPQACSPGPGSRGLGPHRPARLLLTQHVTLGTRFLPLPPRTLMAVLWTRAPEKTSPVWSLNRRGVSGWLSLPPRLVWKLMVDERELWLTFDGERDLRL